MMKISTNWLNDYVDLDNLDLKEVANKITKSGINIEEYTNTFIKNLVIGQIDSIKKHPDSDHLNICMVNIGTTVTQIVCGASNVKEGLKVIVALPGAILPGNFEIKISTIRGVESNGMLCALYELGLEEKTEITYQKGIHELPESAPLGEDPIKYLNLGDVIYGLDLNPNRSDCLSHIGFAYQVGAVLNKEVTLPDVIYEKINEPLNFNLDIDTSNCSLYLLKKVKDVVIKESPEFIKKRLINAGMRPINNVVDISNYIMLEYGQPLHFFDATKVGNTIKVRMANNNEKITTLDKTERSLREKDIVITDGETPIAIAGVMGGANSEVDNNTNTILIESAIFNPYNVRYTSIELDLRSEASLRYEKGLNYEYTYLAMERACYLLEKYASGKVLSDICIYDKIEKLPKIQEISRDKINKYLGLSLTNEEIEEQFKRLGFPYQLNNDNFIVTIPNRRMDVSIKEDLIEEVGSLYGYDNIPSILPVSSIIAGNYEPFVQYRKNITKLIRVLGINETRTHTLVSNKEANSFNYHHQDLVKINKPMNSEKEYLRQSIIPSLLNVLNYNTARGVEEVKIYEIANTYSNLEDEELKLGILLKGNLINNNWKNIKISIDFYVVKGIVENIIQYLGLTNRCQFEANQELPIELHPYVSSEVLIDKEKIGYFGKLHPSFSKDEVYVIELNLSKLYTKKVRNIKYTEPNKYPIIKKDVAFIIDDKINAGDIIQCIKKTGGKLLTNVEVFDVYQGNNIEKGRKSIAFSLTFEDVNKTLTDEDVTKLFNLIIDNVVNKYNAILRDN